MTVTTSMVLLETLVKMLKIMVSNSSKGFNAGVYEYIGDFIKPIKPVLYHTQQWIKIEDNHCIISIL